MCVLCLEAFVLVGEQALPHLQVDPRIRSLGDARAPPCIKYQFADLQAMGEFPFSLIKGAKMNETEGK
jgi:hypothetical protein